MKRSKMHSKPFSWMNCAFSTTKHHPSHSQQISRNSDSSGKSSTRTSRTLHKRRHRQKPSWKHEQISAENSSKFSLRTNKKRTPKTLPAQKLKTRLFLNLKSSQKAKTLKSQLPHSQNTSTKHSTKKCNGINTEWLKKNYSKNPSNITHHKWIISIEKCIHIILERFNLLFPLLFRNYTKATWKNHTRNSSSTHSHTSKPPWNPSR